MSVLDKIPERDKVCVNCKYFALQTNTTDETKCKGTMPCLNFHKENTENYFVPDDLYLKLEFGCEACSQYDDGSYSKQCHECSRYYSDYWERTGEK